MLELVRRMLGLLEGVEGTYTCRCGRGLKVGVSSELWQIKLKLHEVLKLHEACNKETLAIDKNGVTPEESTRFALLEVDP